MISLMQYINDLKSLIQCINEWKDNDILNDINNDILNHYLIHEAFTYDGTARYYTFESLGIFNGCREIVDYVMSDLKTYIEEKNVIIESNDIKDLNNKYFKKLNIVFKEDKSNTVYGEYLVGYSDDDSNDKLENSCWDKENNIFNFINIILYNCDILYINEVAEILTHELIHSWDDYILHSKSFSSLRNKTIDYDEYNKSFDELKRNLYKNDTIKNLNFIDKLLYYLNKFEMNTYIGQLSTELGNTKYDDIEDVVKAIQNTGIYKTYKLLYTVALIDDGKWLVDNGATKSQVNKIKKLVKQAYNKIINHSYLACEDHLKKNVNKGSSNLSFDKTLSYIWKRK